MKIVATLLVCLFLASCVTNQDRPQTYLVSVINLPVGGDYSAVQRFGFETWGVRFRAVCHVPEGWRIKAGGLLNPGGVFEGEGSNGVTWFARPNPEELQNIVLVDIYGPVTNETVRDSSGSSIIPPTFAGTATVSTLDDGDQPRPLTLTNIRLRHADRCSKSNR